LIKSHCARDKRGASEKRLDTCQALFLCGGIRVDDHDRFAKLLHAHGQVPTPVSRSICMVLPFLRAKRAFGVCLGV
jgi:hypothetical protein